MNNINTQIKKLLSILILGSVNSPVHDDSLKERMEMSCQKEVEATKAGTEQISTSNLCEDLKSICAPDDKLTDEQIKTIQAQRSMKDIIDKIFECVAEQGEFKSPLITKLINFVESKTDHMQRNDHSYFFKKLIESRIEQEEIMSLKFYTTFIETYFTHDVETGGDLDGLEEMLELLHEHYPQEAEEELLALFDKCIAAESEDRYAPIYEEDGTQYRDRIFYKTLSIVEILCKYYKDRDSTIRCLEALIEADMKFNEIDNMCAEHVLPLWYKFYPEQANRRVEAFIEKYRLIIDEIDRAKQMDVMMAIKLLCSENSANPHIIVKYRTFLVDYFFKNIKQIHYSNEPFFDVLELLFEHFPKENLELVKNFINTNFTNNPYNRREYVLKALGLLFRYGYGDKVENVKDFIEDIKDFLKSLIAKCNKEKDEEIAKEATECIKALEEVYCGRTLGSDAGPAGEADKELDEEPAGSAAILAGLDAGSARSAGSAAILAGLDAGSARSAGSDEESTEGSAAILAGLAA